MSRIDPLPTPEEMADERYFEIRDVDRDGCGMTMGYAVTSDTIPEEIYRLACLLMMDEMERRERFYIPGPFTQPPTWRQTIKVIEVKRSIRYWNPEKENERNIMERSGKKYTSDWAVKRGGLKFTIRNAWMRIKTNRGTQQSNGYKFGSVI